jgi:NADH:ubiquinone oxidoreductase subunit 6 (subunit J)
MLVTIIVGAVCLFIGFVWGMLREAKRNAKWEKQKEDFKTSHIRGGVVDEEDVD